MVLPKIEKSSWVPGLEEDPQVLSETYQPLKHSRNPEIGCPPPVKQEMRTREHLLTNPTALAEGPQNITRGQKQLGLSHRKIDRLKSDGEDVAGLGIGSDYIFYQARSEKFGKVNIHTVLT